MHNEFIYNPEGFSGHSHCSTIEEFEGNIYLAWYCYKEKEHEQGQIVLSTFDQENKTWSKGKFLFKSLEHSSCGNPTLFKYQNKLHLYFVVLQHYWDTATVYHSTMNPDGSWTEPAKTNLPLGMMVRHRPVNAGVMAVIPMYCEIKMETVLYKFSNDPTQLTLYGEIPEKLIQGDIITTSPQEWQMYLRAAGDHTHVMKALSVDGGRTWPTIQKTQLYCPLSGVAAIKLKSGNILVCNNHTPEHKRSPLSLALSQSKGMSFDNKIWHIDKGEGMELSYPTLLQDSTGLIHLSYTYNRKMIKHSTFTEDEVISKLVEDKND